MDGGDDRGVDSAARATANKTIDEHDGVDDVCSTGQVRPARSKNFRTSSRRMLPATHDDNEY